MKAMEKLNLLAAINNRDLAGMQNRPHAYPFFRGISYCVSLILLLLLAGLSSCDSLKEPEFRNVDNIRLARINREESTLLMDIWYYNPNKARLKLKEASGDAWVDDNFLGTFKMDSLVNIPGREEFSLPVSLQVDMSKLLQNSIYAFLNKEMTVKIKGRARVGKGIFFINYPINYEGKQNMGKLLK